MIKLPMEFFLKEGENRGELTEAESLELDRLTKMEGLRVYSAEKPLTIPYDDWLNREHLLLSECLLLAMKEAPNDFLFLLDDGNRYANLWDEAERWINRGELAADEVPDTDPVEYCNINPLNFFSLALSNDWILSQSIRLFLGKPHSPKTEVMESNTEKTGGRKRGQTQITIFLTELCQKQDLTSLSAESLVRAIKPLVGNMNCPVKKHHGFFEQVCVEWKPGTGSPKGSWGKKSFQNFVVKFKRTTLKNRSIKYFS